MSVLRAILCVLLLSSCSDYSLVRTTDTGAVYTEDVCESDACALCDADTWVDGCCCDACPLWPHTC